MACPVKTILLFAVNCFIALWGLVGCNKTANVDIFPHDEFPFLVHEEETKQLIFDIQNGYDNTVHLHAATADQHIADVENRTFQISKGSTNFSVKVIGKFLGRTLLKFSVTNNRTLAFEQDYEKASNDKSLNDQFDWYELPKQYELAVGRDEGALSHSFTGIVIILVCLANVAMGCKTELKVIKEVLKKPIAPLTGMFSQFVLMPLISLAVVFIFNFDPVVALGFFAMGCSPGGSASNAYSYLLDGDVSLSVTMTFCSTVAALGLVPLWLFTVGQKVIYRTESNVQIPFENILTSLAGLLIPVGIGMILQWKKPKWAKYVVKTIRPIMVIFFILVFTLGVYANLYIFDLMKNTPLILLAGAIVPYVGFLFGGLVSLLTCQSWQRIRTIAIETGIQNTGIAIVLLKVSLPPPDNDISIVAPIAAAIFTPVPMLVAIISYEIYKRCFRKKTEEYYLTDQGSGSNSKIVTVNGLVDEYHSADEEESKTASENNNTGA